MMVPRPLLPPRPLHLPLGLPPPPQHYPLPSAPLPFPLPPPLASAPRGRRRWPPPAAALLPRRLPKGASSSRSGRATTTTAVVVASHHPILMPRVLPVMGIVMAPFITRTARHTSKSNGCSRSASGGGCSSSSRWAERTSVILLTPLMLLHLLQLHLQLPSRSACCNTLHGAKAPSMAASLSRCGSS